MHWAVPVVVPWRCALLTLHQLHEDGDPGPLLDGPVQGHHAGARHGRARRQLLGTEMFHLHLRKQVGTEQILGWTLTQLSLSGVTAEAQDGLIWLDCLGGVFQT